MLGEPPLKMLRYQQQFPFFDISKINESIKFVNLAADLLEGDFTRVLARIDEEVQAFAPSLVFVDSFRSVVQSAKAMDAGAGGLQHFVQQLGMQMTSWLATTFLIGEYLAPEAESSPVFTVADGIVWLSQLIHRDALVRKIQVVKMRGQAQSLGVHTFRINDNGLEIFPRAVLKPVGAAPLRIARRRSACRSAWPQLDDMMGGGLPAGYSLLVVGPSGSGKTVLATQFLAEGVRIGEPGVIAAFEKSPNQLMSHQLNALIASGDVGVINTRTLDLSLDEILHDMVAMILRMKAQACGDRLAVRLRDGAGVDVPRGLPRIAVPAGGDADRDGGDGADDGRSGGPLQRTALQFLWQRLPRRRHRDAALHRTEGPLRRVLSVVKVRGSAHSDEFRFYDISAGGINVGDGLEEYQGILSGKPTLA